MGGGGGTVWPHRSVRRNRAGRAGLRCPACRCRPCCPWRLACLSEPPPPTPNTHTQPPNPTAANKPKNTLRPHPEDRLATLQCNMRDAQFATIFSALGNALPRLTIEEMLFVAYSRTAPNMKGIGMLDALDAGYSGRAPSERFATSRDCGGEREGCPIRCNSTHGKAPQALIGAPQLLRRGWNTHGP